MGKFETSDDNGSRWHKPVRVPINKGDAFQAAREMVADLDGWSLQAVDEEALAITCSKRNGFLGGTSTIVVRVEGPEGIPNSATHCSSESNGALLSRDKGNVAEFARKFYMRVT